MSLLSFWAISSHKKLLWLILAKKALDKIGFLCYTISIETDSPFDFTHEKVEHNN
jgi:hypothetical protein